MRQTSHTWIIDRFRERFQAHETMNSQPFKLLGDTSENRYKLRIYRREARRNRFELHLHQLPANTDVDEERMVVRMGILDSAEKWKSDAWVWPDELINVSYRSLDCLWFKSIQDVRVEPDVFAHVRLDGTLHVRCELYRSDPLKSGSNVETENIQLRRKGSPMPSCSKCTPTKRPATDEAPTPPATARRSLLDTGFLADCTLVSSSGEAVAAERFRAHKCVLASKSEVFAVMFGSGGFVESNADPEVALDTTSARCLKAVLPWIYNGEFLVAEDIQSLEEVLEFANKYDVVDLKLRCELEITKLLNPTNVVRLHGLAVQLVAEDLRAATLAYINDHVQLVLQTLDWDLLKREHPQSAVELLEKSQMIRSSLTDERMLGPTDQSGSDGVAVSANHGEICASRLRQWNGRNNNSIASIFENLDEVMSGIVEDGSFAQVIENVQNQMGGAGGGPELIPGDALEVGLQRAPANVGQVPAVQRDGVDLVADAPEAAAAPIPVVATGSSSASSAGGTQSTSSSVEQGSSGVLGQGSPGSEAQR